MNAEQQIYIGEQIVKFITNELSWSYIKKSTAGPDGKLGCNVLKHVVLGDDYSLWLLRRSSGNIRFELWESNKYVWTFSLRNTYIENNTISCQISVPRNEISKSVYLALQQSEACTFEKLLEGVPVDVFFNFFLNFMCRVIEAHGGNVRKPMIENFNFLHICDRFEKVFSCLTDMSVSILKGIEQGNYGKYISILKKRGMELPFNVFEISSKKYRHENFHSQILKTIFENEDCLYSFLDFLGVNKKNYVAYEVVCEENKIDILIKGKNEKHAIIIENKINWAPDQERQIYRYYEILKRNGYEIDVIIYLIPHISKVASPNSLGKGEELYFEVKEKLKYIVGFDGSKTKDLVSCLSSMNCNSEYGFLLRHYIEILQQTGVGDMSYVARKFFEEMCNIGDSEIASKLKYISDIINDESFLSARLGFWKKIADEKNEQHKFIIEEDDTFNQQYDFCDKRFDFNLCLEPEGYLEDTVVCIYLIPKIKKHYKNDDTFKTNLVNVLKNEKIKFNNCEVGKYDDGSPYIYCVFGKFPAISGEKEAIERLFEIDEKMPIIIKNWENLTLDVVV